MDKKDKFDELYEKIKGLNCDNYGECYVDSFDAGEIIGWARLNFTEK